jgi:hypothetical protein
MKYYKPTYKQIRSLYLITPGPLGLGLSMREAGRALGLSVSAVCNQLKRFRKHHPEAWSQVESMLNSMKRQLESSWHPLRLRNKGIGWEGHIKEKF